MFACRLLAEGSSLNFLSLSLFLVERALKSDKPLGNLGRSDLEAMQETKTRCRQTVATCRDQVTCRLFCVNRVYSTKFIGINAFPIRNIFTEWE